MSSFIRSVFLVPLIMACSSISSELEFIAAELQTPEATVSHPTPGCVPGESIRHVGEDAEGMSYNTCEAVFVENTAPVAALGGQYLKAKNLCILCRGPQMQCVGSDNGRDLMRVLSNTKVDVVSQTDSCGPDTLFFQDTDVTERFREFAVNDAQKQEKRRLEDAQRAVAYQKQLVRDNEVVRRLLDAETNAK